MKRIVSSETWPLFLGATSRAIEQRSLVTFAPHTLMERAGLAVAQLALALRPHAASAWIAAGPGNNGGDGLEAAVHLQAAGWQIELSLFADPQRLPTDAGKALSRARAAGVRITPRREMREPGVAIDALLGLGGNRAPSGALAHAVRDFNSLSCLRLAVDLPSGLNGDTGQAWGDSCVTAHHSLSLLALKPGLFTGAGRDHAGTVWLDDLDVAPAEASIADAWLGPGARTRPQRQHAQHKGNFGDVAVVGGTPGMTGAALLAAHSAHAAGAGRVYVEVLGAAAPTHGISRPELMFRPQWHLGPAEALQRSTIVCGCGGGDAVRAALPRLLSLAGKLVLDADALNAVAVDTQLRQLLRARRPATTVLTPHPLEAARLLSVDTSTVQADRLMSTRRLAEELKCVVLLKGSGTVVTAPGERLWINSTGNAALATAGTGDVLAGWIGGSWSASATQDALEITRSAAWLHGRCADLADTVVLRAADLIEAMHLERSAA